MKGFYWTVDWVAVCTRAAYRFPEGHHRRKYWLERAAVVAVEGPESEITAGSEVEAATDTLFDEEGAM